MNRFLRPTLGLVAGTALALSFPGAAFATDADDDDDTSIEISICHDDGGGNFSLITIEDTELQEHLAHGDGFPAQATEELDINCDTQPLGTTFRVETADMVLGASGWAVAVCPAGTRAVSGGFAPDTAVVTVSEVAVAGSTYGDFTFGPEQTGWVVQTTDAATVKVFVDCEPIM
jgi:hypothetical protein